MNKIKRILLAAAIAVGAIGAVGSSATTVEAGRYCSLGGVLYQRSGDYVTYTAYATGEWYDVHRVKVLKNGITYYGPTVWGTGSSILTLYAPGYAGIATCQVLN